MTFLGIDCGTSALKAVLVDDTERLIAASTQAYLPSHPHPLWSEQNPDDWRDAMFDALGALAREAPAAMGAVAAIGFSGQMHSAVLLDKADRPRHDIGVVADAGGQRHLIRGPERHLLRRIETAA